MDLEESSFLELAPLPLLTWHIQLCLAFYAVPCSFQFANVLSVKDERKLLDLV